MRYKNKIIRTKLEIEYVATNIVEFEKAVQTIVDEITQFWGSLVQDEQLHQLDVQLGEAEV